jgi:hypothetical protein
MMDNAIWPGGNAPGFCIGAVDRRMSGGSSIIVPLRYLTRRAWIGAGGISSVVATGSPSLITATE